MNSNNIKKEKVLPRKYSKYLWFINCFGAVSQECFDLQLMPGYIKFLKKFPVEFTGLQLALRNSLISSLFFLAEVLSNDLRKYVFFSKNQRPPMF
jgi:hypothetical protein